VSDEPRTFTPTAVVLAGINGAGKTTASRALLADTLHLMTFVNADIIAQGLCGFNPESVAIQAGRIMLDQLHDLAKRRENFAFETTLAARTYASWLNSIRQTGYEVSLFYFWLKSADLAVSRVANRVLAGGHHIPEVTIRQRYSRSVRNLFELYMPVVTTWKVYDNSEDGGPRFIAEGGREKTDAITDPETWNRIKKVIENG
jgi:predicted ABC-type ATPase